MALEGSRLTGVLIAGAALAAAALLWVLFGGDGAGGATSGAGALAGSAQGTDSSARPNAGLASAPSPEEVAQAPIAARAAAPGSVPAAKPKASAKSTPKSGPRVLGRVLSSEGSPVVAAEVEMERGEQALALVPALGAATRESATTDAFGQFALPAKPGSLVSFKVKAEGFIDFEVSQFTLPEDLTLPLQDFVLSPSAILHGRVVDTRGQSLAGAEVFRGNEFFQIGGKKKADAVCDERGEFELSDQALGDWRLRVEAEGYPPRIFVGSVNQAGKLREPLRLELPVPAPIRGQALGVPQNQLGRVRVRAQPKSSDNPFDLERMAFANLDAEGRFELLTLDPALQYELSLLPSGSDPMTITGFAGLRSEPVTAPAGSNAVTLRYIKGADVRLRVIDAESRAPIEAFGVVMGSSFALTPLTGQDGQPLRFHPGGNAVFEDVHGPSIDMGDSASWRLRVDAEGYVAGRLEGFEVPKQGEVNLGEIALVKAPLVTVRVIDAGNGKPVRAAQVRLTRKSAVREAGMGGMEDFLGEPSSRERTNGDGEVRLTSFAEEPSVLTVVKSGYATHIQEDLVVGLAERTVEVRLFEEGEVEVSVVDSDGQPVRGVRVRRESVSDEEDSNSENTDGAGRVLFRKLAAGTHRFQLRDGETEFFAVDGRVESREVKGEWKTVEVASGAKSRLTLVQAARSTVEVSVRSKGRLLGSIYAELFRLPPGGDFTELETKVRAGEADSVDSETTDVAGRAEFTRVERGEYLLALRADQVRVPTFTRLVVDQARETLTVDLPSASVSGRVVDPSGKPLAGLRVSLAAKDRGNPGGGGRGRRFGRGNTEDAIVIGSLDGASTKPGETDSAGRFTIEGAPVGVELEAWANGSSILGSKSKAFQLGVDEQLSGLEIVASLAGTVVVELQTSGTSRPALVFAEAVELVEDQEGERKTATSWGGDDLSVGPLKPGTWRIKVSSGSWRDEEREVLDTREVSVRSGETERYQVRLP